MRIFQSFCACIWKRKGYTVNMADDGGRGVELYRRLKPDLAPPDLMLPVLDGWGAVHPEDRRRPSSCSRQGETIDKVAGLKQGAGTPVPPPSPTRALRRSLRRAGEGENGKSRASRH